MNILETHIVPTLTDPQRLQEYAVGIFKSVATRSAIKKAIKKGIILVDQETSSTATWIKGGETIQLLEVQKSTHKVFDLTLEVLFEDEHLAIINKPAGVLVSGNSFATIDNALNSNLQVSTLEDTVRPRPTHRLDYPTSGLLLIGKTSSAILQLNQLFEHKQIQKTYHAVTIGKMQTEGKISLDVDGKESLSFYKVLDSVPSKRFNHLNLVELSPKTGRRHQLRKHLSSLGNPILGDKEYGKGDLILKGKGLYLHASQLTFIHPFTQKEMQVNTPLPKKFLKIFPQ